MPLFASGTVPHCDIPGQVTVVPLQYCAKKGSSLPGLRMYELKILSTITLILAKIFLPYINAWSTAVELVISKA